MSSSHSAPAAPQPETSPLTPWHVQFHSGDGVLQLILPSLIETGAAVTWAEIWEQIQQRLAGAKRFWQPMTPVEVQAQDRLLDGRQLQAIAAGLQDVQLELRSVVTNRRQTAVAAATAGYSVQQQEPSLAPPQTVQAVEPLYLQMTVRSGAEVRHPGTVVIVGDVNPGGVVIAAGDIIIWGRLRGIAHAGSMGNESCLIMALHLHPTQLRIASHVARSPEQGPEHIEPEVAYVAEQSIRITAAADVKSIPALVERQFGSPTHFFV